MKLIFTIALRNLLRQKRRNILLGSAIAFGAMILIVASSFSHGITNTLFERIVVYVAGHVGVSVSEGSNMYCQVFHDGDYLKSVMEKVVPEHVSIDESVGGMARAIGNGRSDNIMMVGFNVKAQVSPEELKKAMENFKMVEGDFMNLVDSTLENPTILSVEKAKYLNVKMGDVLRIRFQDIHGQNQAARLTVAGIFKPANLFMSMPIFVDLQNVKQLMGYGPHDVGQFFISIKDPIKNAVRTADRLQQALKPGLAVMQGNLTSSSNRVSASMLTFKCDSMSLKTFREKIPLIQGAPDTAFSLSGAVISAAQAKALSAKNGDTLRMVFKAKFTGDTASFRVVIKGIRQDTLLNPVLALINERDFYRAYYNPYAAAPDSLTYTLLPDSTASYYKALGTQWNLQPRARTTDELQKIMKESAKVKSRVTGMGITSMYESASAIIKLEYALNLITFIMVTVLFFIILIGVVNTLRMTIRERTREIGTVRAIGMQRADVRNTFIAEVSFLALFASVVGTLLAFIIMKLLGLITIDAADNPMGMLLVSGHLQFVPTALSITGFNLLIMLIAALTAFFPARRASNMDAVQALRHYE